MRRIDNSSAVLGPCSPAIIKPSPSSTLFPCSVRLVGSIAEIDQGKGYPCVEVGTVLEGCYAHCQQDKREQVQDSNDYAKKIT